MKANRDITKSLTALTHWLSSCSPFASQWSVWWLTLLYYVSLAFVKSNLMLLLVSCVYVFALMWLRKSLTQALWLSMIATAFISKGKTLVITLIPKANLMNGVFDVNYILPFYLNDALLIGLLLQVWRTGQWQQFLPKKTLAPVIAWLIVFQLNILWPSWQHVYAPIILGSAVQFLKLIIIFILPSLIFKISGPKLDLPKATTTIIVAAFLAQSLWALWQMQNHGLIGKYIEAPLAGSEYGVVTREDPTQFRATGWFFDSALLGTFLTCGLAFLSWRLIHPEKPWQKKTWFLYIGLAVVCALGIVATLNRILIVVAGVLAFWLGRHLYQQTFMHSHRRWFIVTLLAVIGFSLPLLLPRFESIATAFQPYGSGQYRIEQLLYSWRLVDAYPQGVGLGLSPFFFATGFANEQVSFDPAHPHNLLLHILAETGWVGLITFIMFLYWVFRSALQGRAKLTDYGFAALTYLFCAQWYPIFINQSELAWYLFFFLGCFFAMQPVKIHNSTTHHSKKLAASQPHYS